MAEILKGAPVAKALNEKMIEKVLALKGRGVEPMLAILRVGEKADDISYEKGAMKRCEQVGLSRLLMGMRDIFTLRRDMGKRTPADTASKWRNVLNLLIFYM